MCGHPGPLIDGGQQFPSATWKFPIGVDGINRQPWRKDPRQCVTQSTSDAQAARGVVKSTFALTGFSRERGAGFGADDISCRDNTWDGETKYARVQQGTPNKGQGQFGTRACLSSVLALFEIRGSR